MAFFVARLAMIYRYATPKSLIKCLASRTVASIINAHWAR